MSKIWHSPQEIPLFDDTVVFIDDLNNWHTGYTQRDNDGITDHDSGEIYTEENVLRWAYIKDLLALETKLDRTRKELDIRKKQVEIANKAFDFIDTEWDNVDCSRKELGACAFNAKEDIAGWESDIETAEQKD